MRGKFWLILQLTIKRLEVYNQINLMKKAFEKSIPKISGFGRVAFYGDRRLFAYNGF